MVGFAISRLLHRIVWHSVKLTVGALSSGSCPQVNRDFKIEDARRACKPDFVSGRRPGDGHSSKRAIARALLAANPDLWAKAACGDIGNPIKPAQGPYSALLPVGLAMRRLLPAPRWALTPPIHPYRRLCRARPCTTAVCFLWRFPSGYPARALPGTVALWSPDFPRSKLTPRPFSLPHTNLCKFWLVIGQYLFTIFLPPVEKAWDPIYKQTHHHQDRSRTGLFLDLQ